MKQHIARTVTGVIAGAVALALVLSGCGPATPGENGADGSETPVPGGVLQVGLGIEMPSLDPRAIGGPSTGQERGMAIFDTIMTTENGVVVPKTAESLEPNDDASVWTLTIKEGIEFTDGTPYDAEAIVYNLERAIAPDSPSGFKGFLANLTDMEATGDLTVEFTFSQPFGQFPAVLSDQTSLGMIGSPTALEADPEGFARNPVGAGPFMFESWVTDQQMVLVKNPNYFVEGQPYLDGITFNLIPDTDSRFQALLAGDVDYVWGMGGFQYAEVRDGGEFYAVEGAPYVGGAGLIFNQNKGPGADPRVREAASMAFDARETSLALSGLPDLFTIEDVDCVPFGVDNPACLKGDHLEQDLDTARELIADYVADGGDVNLQLMTFPTELSADYVQQTLNNIGLNVTIDRGVPADLPGRYTRGEYEAATLVVPTAPFFPRLYNLFSSQNANRLQTTELDPFIQTARDAVDLDVQAEAYQGLQEYLADSDILTWYSPLVVFMIRSVDVHSGPAVSSTDLVNWGPVWLTPAE